MELVERYLQEVGRYLPSKGKSDVLAELRSLLEDTIEERGGREAADEVVAAVLKEFGEPRRVAANYAPERNYLIGPEMYPALMMVWKIGALGVGVAALVTFALDMVNMPGAFGDALLRGLEAFAGFVTMMLSFIGGSVLVFAGLERTQVKVSFDTNAEFDPQKLPQTVDERDRVTRASRIGNIVGSIIGLSLLAWVRAMGGVVVTFSPGFDMEVIPVPSGIITMMIALVVASIVLEGWLFGQERWTVPTRVFKIVLNVLNIMLAYVILQGFDGWIAGTALAQSPLSLVGDGLAWVFIIVIVVNAIEIAFLGYHLGLRPIVLHKKAV